MAVGAITLFSPDRDLSALLWIAGAYLFVAAPSCSIWVLAGRQFQNLLSDERRLWTFNRTMAAFLILSMTPALLC